MSAQQDLIARLEKATGPDRELDAEIALTQGWTEFPGDNWCGPHAEIVVPAYTSSLDAALSLVPEGMDWLVRTQCSALDPGCYAHVMIPRPGEHGTQGEAYAITPIIALCIAALKAREVTP